MPKRDPPSPGYVAVKKAFARNLHQAMMKKGWSQSELARRASGFTPSGKIARDTISKYLSTGKSGVLPSPVALHAVAKALDLKPEDLLPTERTRLLSGDAKPSSLSMDMVDENTASLVINQKVPLAIALKIMALVHEAKEQK